jgi:hypothetical protein
VDNKKCTKNLDKVSGGILVKNGWWEGRGWGTCKMECKMYMYATQFCLEKRRYM